MRRAYPTRGCDSPGLPGEARFEARSYGFDRVAVVTTRSRPCSTRCAARTARRLWILDADLAAAFDRIDHDHLLSQLGVVPRAG